MMKNYSRKILFRLKWMAMSEKGRYAYLWSRTREDL